MPFAAIGSGRVPADDPDRREPARRTADRSATARPGLLLGLAALTRNEAVWLALDLGRRGWFGARRRRRARVRLIGVAGVVALVVFAPWGSATGSCSAVPLPGQAVTNALSVTGLRHLRLERSADPVAIPRGRAGAPRRHAHRGLRPQPVHRAAAAGVPDLADRPRSPCPGRLAGVRSDPSCSSRVTFLVTSLRVSRSRRRGARSSTPRARSTSCSSSRPCALWMPLFVRLSRGSAGRSPSRGSGRPSASCPALLFSVRLAAGRSATGRGRPRRTYDELGATDGRGRPTRSTNGRPR